MQYVTLVGFSTKVIQKMSSLIAVEKKNNLYCHLIYIAFTAFQQLQQSNFLAASTILGCHLQFELSSQLLISLES
jgi:hypothetical protein